MSTLDVIVGGQYGSESKGRVTLEVAERRLAENPDTEVIGIRVAGPNAGHVVIDKGHRFALRQLPVVFPIESAHMYIAPGSEIDLEVLLAEIALLASHGYQPHRRLTISPDATIIRASDRRAEAELVGRIGSTGKGIGSARAGRLMRTAPTMAHYTDEKGTWMGIPVANLDLNDRLQDAEDDVAVVIEGTQGYGLGLHAGEYPYCTSSNCRAIDFLAMADIVPWTVPDLDDFMVTIVARVNPIRVAGPSGPLKGETTWSELGLPEEHTTVTQKVRRVGEWDPELIRRAVVANGGAFNTQIALAMLDHEIPELAGVNYTRDLDALPIEVKQKVADWITRVQEDTGTKVAQIGTGPSSAVWMV